MNNMTGSIEKGKRGQQMTNTKRFVVIHKLLEYLSESYYTTGKLAKLTGLSYKTVETYRPFVDRLLAERRVDRNTVRNLQVNRTYKMIERMVLDLDDIEAHIKDVGRKIQLKATIYGQIVKYSSHLALITGLNIETQVNVEQKQLVIIRAGNNSKPRVDYLEAEIAKESGVIGMESEHKEESNASVDDEAVDGDGDA